MTFLLLIKLFLTVGQPQPGPILQQSCLSLQNMSWHCSLLSSDTTVLRKAKQNKILKMSFTSIELKNKLVTTAFLFIILTCCTAFEKLDGLIKADHRRRNWGTMFIFRSQSQTKTWLLMLFIERIFIDVVSSWTFHLYKESQSIEVWTYYSLVSGIKHTFMNE